MPQSTSLLDMPWHFFFFLGQSWALFHSIKPKYSDMRFYFIFSSVSNSIIEVHLRPFVLRNFIRKFTMTSWELLTYRFASQWLVISNYLLRPFCVTWAIVFAILIPLPSAPILWVWMFLFCFRSLSYFKCCLKFSCVEKKILLSSVWLKQKKFLGRVCLDTRPNLIKL